MMMVPLTSERRANLETLASYLESLPPDYGKFDMRHWFRSSGHNRISEFEYGTTGCIIKEGDCRTSACALGHGPAAGILVGHEEMLPGNSKIDWAEYGSRFCSTSDSGMWGWFFGGVWDTVDREAPNHYAAAARIRYVLENGDVPTRWRMGWNKALEPGGTAPTLEDYEPCIIPYLKEKAPEEA